MLYQTDILFKSLKQIARYLIYYPDNRAKYLQKFMRQCVKPAKIDHALKRRPCWERQTRLIPSVFYMLPFLHIFKLKTIRGHCFRWTTFFSPQIKKSPYATFKILGISEKQRIKLNIFVNFFKKKHFFWWSVKYL